MRVMSREMESEERLTCSLRSPDCFPAGGRISGGVDVCACVCLRAQLVHSCVVSGHTVDSLPGKIPTRI